jgi:hypothetical protein
MVTHPHHPLRGRRVEVIRVRRGVDPDLIVRLPDGRHAAIAMSWTADAFPPEPTPPVGTVPLLAVDGLREMLSILQRLQPEARAATGEADAVAGLPTAPRYDSSCDLSPHKRRAGRCP